MKMLPTIKHNWTGSLLVLGLCVFGTQANASTTSNSGTVTANVQASCALGTAMTIDFGTISNIGPLGSDITASGTIALSCSNGAPYTVYIGDGANRASAGNGVRNMANGGARLPYQLYKDAGRTNIWDETGGTSATGGAGGLGGTGSGSGQSLTVYAKIASGTVLPSTPGTYTDTVLVTLTY